MNSCSRSDRRPAVRFPTRPPGSTRPSPSATCGCTGPHFDAAMRDIVNPLEYPLDELLMIHVLSQGKGRRGPWVRPRRRRADARISSPVSRAPANRRWRAAVGAATPGVTLLSDERIVLRTDRDPIAVYRHAVARRRAAGLAALRRSGRRVFSEHASGNTVTPLSGPLAMARLFSCSFLPFHGAAPVNHTAHRARTRGEPHALLRSWLYTGCDGRRDARTICVRRAGTTPRIRLVAQPFRAAGPSLCPAPRDSPR